MTTWPQSRQILSFGVELFPMLIRLANPARHFKSSGEAVRGQHR